MIKAVPQMIILRLLIADMSEISAELTVSQIKVNIILIDREQIRIKIVIDNRAVDIFNSQFRV